MIAQSFHLVIFCWVFFAFTTLFVAARLYIQLYFRTNPWRECFVLVAWLTALGYSVIYSLMNDWDWFNPIFFEDNNIENWDAELLANMKLQYMSGFISMTCLYACKAALLCFYVDLTPRAYFPKTWWAITVSWVFCIIGFSIMLISLLVRCRPFSQNLILGSSCRGNLGVNFTNTGLHLFTDILVFSIPFFMLRNLHQAVRVSKPTWFMFGMGTVNIFFAASLVVNNLWFHETIELSRRWKDTLNYFLALKVYTAVLIVCMPYVRRLWRGIRDKDLKSLGPACSSSLNSLNV